MRALLDCPVHAIIELGQPRPSRDEAAHSDARETPEPDPKTDDNEAISEFVR
jgi:ferredoxin